MALNRSSETAPVRPMRGGLGAAGAAECEGGPAFCGSGGGLHAAPARAPVKATRRERPENTIRHPSRIDRDRLALRLRLRKACSARASETSIADHSLPDSDPTAEQPQPLSSVGLLPVPPPPPPEPVLLCPLLVVE